MTLFVALLFVADPPVPRIEAHFESVVRPLLIENCQKCHGPKKQNGGLRLDRPDGAIKGGDSGPAVVRGRPEESLLLKAIKRHPDVSPMPPDKPLAAESVRALETWIRDGAVWPETKSSRPALGDTGAIDAAAKKHWAFQSIRNSSPPPTKRRDWSATSIDQFLLAKMESEGLEPSADADRTTLLRRTSFDLLGLPPTPEEVDSFVSDPDPTPLAFAKVVDRMLASPHYGERWGRHWLDVARYADTKGYVFQEERRYPFSYTYRDWVIDAFNDDLPYDQFVRYQIAADKMAGADDRHLAAMGFLTVGRRFLQDIHEITDDRIDVVTRGVLGLTVSCARCHDHKYDPVSMADYYGLYGVFASSEEPKDLPILKGPGGGAQRADFESKMKERVGALNKYLDEQHAVAERRLLEDALKLLQLNLTASGKNDPRGLTDAARQMGLSPGAVRRWNERWTKTVADAAKKDADAALVVWRSLASLPEKEYPAKAPAVVAKLRDEIGKRANPALAALLKKPLNDRSKLPAEYAGFVREAAKAQDAAKRFPALFGDDGAFRIPRAEVQQYFDRKQRERSKALERTVEELKVKHPGAEARAMVMVDKPQPLQPRIFLRGNPGRIGPPTTKAMPVVLTGGQRRPFKEGSGRKELAEAIASRDNPLTARVFANRIWQWRFGKGLAPSPSDFGLRSDPPTHPELLDHLARRLTSDGWSMKSLHRLMLHSRAYQTSSNATAAQIAADPDNRLLARFPRIRLDWESLRDSALAVSGELDETVRGRPTPLFAEPSTRRRTLYGFIDRQNLDAAYRTFDFATPDATSPQRFVTIVPQQGLFLLNSKFIASQSERFANRLEFVAEKDVRKRVERMFRFAFSRTPTSEEIGRAVAFLTSQPDWPQKQQSSWTRLGQALMTSNEFAFID
jgi:hypothetical protein